MNSKMIEPKYHHWISTRVSASETNARDIHVQLQMNNIIFSKGISNHRIFIFFYITYITPHIYIHTQSRYTSEHTTYPWQMQMMHTYHNMIKCVSTCWNISLNLLRNIMTIKYVYARTAHYDTYHPVSSFDYIVYHRS